MRTQIYEHRSGLKVVPNVIVADVEKLFGILTLCYPKKQWQTSRNPYESD